MKAFIHNLSLKGITGILLGVYSLIFIYCFNLLINLYSTSPEGISLLPISFFEKLLLILSLLFVLISYLTIVGINRSRRKKIGLKGWDLNAKQVRKLFLIHLLLGGICIYFLMNQGALKFIVPSSLILYGIFNVVVNKFTSGPTNILGIFFLLQGIMSFLNPNFIFLLWGIAFGCFHIIYGSLHYFKWTIPRQQNPANN